MSVVEFIQLVIRNKRWVLYFPIIVGLCVLLLTFNMAHTYDADMEIYTGIASGFNPDSDFGDKIDFHAVNSRFDNLINIINSRGICRDVALKLLAFMIHNPDKRHALLDNSKNSTLNSTIDTAFVAKNKKENPEATEKYLRAQLDSCNEKNDVYQLIYGKEKNPFNVKVLEDIKAERQGFSDMLKISYTCEDPFTCKKTLDLIKDLFLDKYQSMRIGEADQAVKYFQEQTALAKAKLNTAEDMLKQFRSNNKVINYYEQTKYIADQNEDIEKNISALQMELEGHRTALEQVEDRIGKRYLIQLQSDKIVHTRDSLAAELNKMGLEAVKDGSQVETTPTVENLKTQLKQSVDKLYSLNNTTEGIPGKKLFDEWVRLTIVKQETQSKLEVLLGNKTEFEKVFSKYAPMGSELNKLEREVETNEKEYLNLLHNLNQAILRARNLEVSENISVIDDAEMPIVPNPGKRIILIIASVLSCVIVAAVVLIIRQYLDHSLASPINLEKAIGIPAASAFMLQNVKNLTPTTIDEMDQRALERWRIALGDILDNPEEKVTLMALPFNCSVEAATHYSDKLCAFLQNKGLQLERVSCNDYVSKDNGHTMVVADKIFPELLPKALMEDTKTVYIFFDAAQKLDEYQAQVIEKWKNTGIPAKGVLVNTSLQHTSKYLGEIPLKRSKIRTFVKKQFMRYAG